MALATATWSPLGDNAFYRKFEIYAMDWSVPSLDKVKVRAAPYGGPIAILPEVTRADLKPTITIFNAAGQKIGQKRWDSGEILDLGWSLSEELLVVQTDGKVLVYDMFGDPIRQHSMGQEVQETKAVDCRIFRSSYGTGVAVLTSTYRIFMIANLDDVRIRRLDEIPGIDRAPSSWQMVSHDRESSALVAVDADLYLLNQGGTCTKQNLGISGDVMAFTEMSVSFNNKYLALFTDSGTLYLCSSDLKRTICQMNTKVSKRPLQMVWCGTGAIVLYWRERMVLFGTGKHFVNYVNDTPVYLTPELDCIRVIGSFSQDLLQKVPEPCHEVFKIGSMSPGAVLLDAWRDFRSQSERAQECLQVLANQLTEGVEMCVAAAGHEFDVQTQKDLLKAASFGRCFLEKDTAEVFVEMCRLLRVLNCVREFTVGMPLTYPQLQHMTVEVLIHRLVGRRLYPLATALCEYLKLPSLAGKSKIIKHWASLKVCDRRADEMELARQIMAKVAECRDVNISEIADKAIMEGRTQLAIQLLEAEPRAAEQVPLLLKLKQETLALNKAIDSGDTDLIYRVVLEHLKKKLDLGEFYRVIREKPQAQALFLQYCRAMGHTRKLQHLYYQEDNHAEEAACRVQAAYLEPEFSVRVDGLKEAQKCYTKATLDWAARQTEEQIRLLKHQQKLEETLSGSYLDLSLHQTMARLLTTGQPKLAEQLRKDFRVPDRKWWWMKVRALGEIENWTELDKFAKSKKSPIGYEPFIAVCMEKGKRQEARKYLTRVSADEKVKCLITVGDLEAALELAQQRGSDVDLALLITRSNALQRRDLAERATGALRALNAS